MKHLTYEGWRLAGFYVRKGEKATGRDPKTGKTTFSRDQVESFDLDRKPFNPDSKD